MMFYDDQFIIHIFWLSNATNGVFLFFCAEKKQRQLHELTGSARSKFFHGVNFATEQVHLLGLLLPHFHHQKKQFATPRVLPPSHSQLYAQVRSSKWGLCQFRSDISEIWGSQCCVGIESPGIMGWPRIIVMISTAGCKCFKQLLHSLPLQAFSLAPGACDPSVDYHSVYIHKYLCKLMLMWPWTVFLHKDRHISNNCKDTNVEARAEDCAVF